MKKNFDAKYAQKKIIIVIIIFIIKICIVGLVDFLNIFNLLAVEMKG